MALVLLFSIADETYGFEIEDIQEVVEDPSLHFVPKAGGVLVAAVNFHGRILPVIDLANLLGFTEAGRDHRLVVLTPENESLVMTVSSVEKIFSLDLTELQPAPTGKANNAIRGVLDLDGRIINLLDADRIVHQLQQLFAE